MRDFVLGTRILEQHGTAVDVERFPPHPVPKTSFSNKADAIVGTPLRARRRTGLFTAIEVEDPEKGRAMNLMDIRVHKLTTRISGTGLVPTTASPE